MPLQLLRRPKSKNWVMRGTVRGRRVEESTGTSDKRFAEEIRAKREAELLAESVYGKKGTLTFAQAALSYLELGGCRRLLEKPLRHFGATPLSRLDQAALDEAALRLYPTACPATRNRQFYTPVSAVLHYAAKRRWCDPPLLERPRQSPVGYAGSNPIRRKP